MADFKTALQKTLAFEGGYSKVEGDRGGETYRGISRNHWGSWPGWGVVDSHLQAGRRPEALEKLSWLNRLVEEFYLREFWRPIRGDEIALQAIADELFDSAVNCGRANAVRWLQQGLNMACGAGVQIDGAMGQQTLGAIAACRYPEALLKAMDGFQFGHYCGVIKKDALQIKFFRGWLRRIWK